MMRYLLLLTLLVLPIANVLAEESAAKLEAVPDVPAPPLPVKSGDTLEPDITIVRKGKKTIQEYRRGGRLYMIKVIPDVGPAYYFLDTDGDEKMDVQGSDLDRGGTVNMWKLLEWN
jgi:hypothetical protein